MDTLKPVKSLKTLANLGEHYQLVIFERVVTWHARYPDEEDLSETFPRIYAVKDRVTLQLAIEAARHDGKEFIVYSAVPLNPDIVAPERGVILG